MIDGLKIIPSDSIFSFESPCAERTGKLTDEILREGKMRNPLLVYPIDEKFLLLDNVSIFSALRALEVTHVPVQLARAADVSVHPWQRLVMGFTEDDLGAFCRLFPRKIQVDDSAAGRLKRNQAEVRFANGRKTRISILSPSALVRADICGKLHTALSRSRRTCRVKVDYHDQAPFDRFLNASAVLFPPMFLLDDLATIARSGAYLPQGFVRIDQPGRILGIDYSLAILREKVSAEEKESFLQELLKLRVSTDRIAYYNGAVFMYNN